MAASRPTWLEREVWLPQSRAGVVSAAGGAAAGAGLAWLGAKKRVSPKDPYRIDGSENTKSNYRIMFIV